MDNQEGSSCSLKKTNPAKHYELNYWDTSQSTSLFICTTITSKGLQEHRAADGTTSLQSSLKSIQIVYHKTAQCGLKTQVINNKKASIHVMDGRIKT